MFTSTRLFLAGLTVALSAGACADFGKCASAQCAEDARIRAVVMQRIDQRPSLRFFNIDVQASDRDVYLLGLVDTEIDRYQAEQVASAVPGVKRVYDGLELMGNGRH
jgi:osmotically-inducible protein OsmY